MSRKRRRSETEEIEIDMTAMLDIVFIMLIFFIVTTSFVQPTGIGYNTPESNTPTNSNRSNNILISIDENGLITVANRYVDIERVTANIEQLMAEAPEASVVILADTVVKHGKVVRVMDQVKKAGVTKISVTKSA